MKVLVLDNVAEEGLVPLRQDPELDIDVRGKMSEDELCAIIGGYEAVIVRSATKITARVLEAGRLLKVVGRAGVGVDNIDLDAATRQGVLVVNAPDGNTIAAAEHTMALMLALARLIPQACSSLRDGRWEKKAFVGVELKGKTLGVLGLGRIGSEVAKRALAMEMRVVAYDPFINEDKAALMGVDVLSLDEVFKEADFITSHLPLTQDSRYIIDDRAFDLMKKGVRIINCARGGIVDEAALVRALESGLVAGAALDVFEKEPATDHPLLQFPNFIATPHLGASTREAQLGVAVDVSKEIVAALKGRLVKNTVNVPSINPQSLAMIKPFLALAEKLGRFLSQAVSGRMKKVEVTYSGELLQYEVTPLTTAVVKGLLDPILQQGVNYVNATLLAKNRGIQVFSTTAQNGGYNNLITVRVVTDQEEMTIAATVFHGSDFRLVSVDGYRMDAVPDGHMLYIPHIDRPRIIGPVGSLIGSHNINIAGMQVGRKVVGGKAIMLLQVDAEVPDETLQEITRLDGVLGAKKLYV
ncbi:MAG TPA: phosphoglycerate dehydrogenase [Spirochaetia bacterium]|nr:phosphoglycerate dehydrogenase [Spirochaetia bacterium]